MNGWLVLRQGFIDAVPEDHFNVVDMGYSGSGEWHKWNDSSFFETKYVWTALMNFGGTNGIKGNLTHVRKSPLVSSVSFSAQSQPCGSVHVDERNTVPGTRSQELHLCETIHDQLPIGGELQY